MNYKEKMIVAVMILVAVIMLLGCTVTTSYPTTFHVTDGTGNVAGALVTVDGKTATTDADGLATVSLAASVTPYTFTVKKAGYVTASDSVTVPAGGLTANVAVTLSLDSILSS